MHPKRIRERIQKAQKFINHHTQYNFSSKDQNLPTPIAQKNSLPNIYNLISQAADKVQQDNQGQLCVSKFMQEMQSRDHYVLLDAPTLSIKTESRQKQIKVWLGDICRHIFSVSFNNFSHKVFDTQTMKIFTSQCFIGNIIALSKINNLTQQDFQLINLHLKNNLLPYFLLRYPQSSNKQVNQKLNKQVSATDYLDTNENNMFLKSGIQIQYRENGLYFDIIMKFINYIQELPDKVLKEQDGQTMFDDFNERMEKLFTSVFNRKWTESKIYDEYSNSNQSVDTLRKKVSQLQSNIGQKSGSKNQDKDLQQKTYEDLVKSYTSYAINRKISQNVPKYTADQISHGSIKILDPSILRIIVKWCLELQQKFQNQYFMQRNDPFIMLNGQQVEMNDQIRKSLCDMASEQWKSVKAFLSNIEANIYQKQSQLSFRNLMYYSECKLPQYQQSLIKFANRNTEDVNHYAVLYLNLLIHSMMKLSKRIYQEQLKGWAQWPYCPIFVSFTISDLMRCKCLSNQKEIIRIYKELEIQSEINPQIMRIVKVKNRLNRGTKDILLNVLFHKQVLIQIQLTIKVSKSQFALFSDKFNHYIYELARSTYGPVTEMCSIWSSNDQRSSLMPNQKLRVAEFDHACSSKSNTEEIMPFTCSLCYQHFSQSRFIYDHYKCKNCEKFWTCALCRINTLDQESLIKELKSKDKQIQMTRMIPAESEDFPEYFVGFRVESISAIGQKFRKFTYDNVIMLAKYQKDDKLRVITFRKNDKKSKINFFKKFIFFEMKEKDPKLQKVSIQDVIDQTTIVEIQACYKKKSQALRLTRKNITTELLLKIKDHRAQGNIYSLSLPQNKIDSLVEIGTTFPQLTMLNLNKNNLKSMQGLKNLTELTDLYLGENHLSEFVQLQNLVKLKYCQLGDNPTNPQFNCDLSKLTALESLTIVRSNLLWFPQNVCKLKNLKLLWMFENKIKVIPPSIKELKNLQYLHLEMNEVQDLPPEFYTLKKMKKLMLGYNKIKQVTADIAQFEQLQILELQGNPIVTIADHAILKMQILKTLTLNQNQKGLFHGRSNKNIEYK